MKRAAHSNLFQTSDFIAAICIAIAAFFEYLVPTSFSPYGLPAFFVGLALLLCGSSLILGTKWCFRSVGQKTRPRVPTTALITHGILQWSRNPIYLGVLFILAGIGFVADSIWIMLGVVPAYVGFHYFLILPEEKYLEEVFGDTYRTYKKKVGRWF